MVGKDLYLDSTSKLDSVLHEDTVPLKGGSGPSATTTPAPSSTSNSPQEDHKQGNAEPRSEESDAAGVCVYVCLCVFILCRSSKLLFVIFFLIPSQMSSLSFSSQYLFYLFFPGCSSIYCN